MTKAAQVFGKDLRHFWENQDTTAYILALGNANLRDSGEYARARDSYVEASRGRHGGTWAHPKLAVFFASWLDVRFSVWCDAVIGDILARCWVPQRFPETQGYRCDLREVGPQGFSLPWTGAQLGAA